jgi:hydroxyacylglutathione hydrolase
MTLGCIISAGFEFYRMCQTDIFQRGVFQRFWDEGLAQASFLVGCDRTKQAVVIDPRRDASVHEAAAQQLGMRIVAAIETHVHADFVSGARELAATGARVYAGPGAGLEYDHHAVRDGETLPLGDLTLTFLHTPGHTPEHISILAEAQRQPARLFTGDLLFVGGVGRPDLLGEAQTRRLAHQLFDSLQRIMALDDRIEVHPGHGAGSLCGAGIGKEPSSTIAAERRQNAMLQHHDREAFVAAVLADIPDTPPYFARMKRVNTAGPALLKDLRTGRLPGIRPAAAAALAADGALVLDLRDGATFAAGHPYGALNLAFGPKLGYWAGWVVAPDAPLLILADDPAHAEEAATQLLRVGLERIEGTIAGGFDAWTGAGLPVSEIGRMSVGELRAALQAKDDLRVVDVRTPREWSGGHIDGSINIPVGQIPARARELPVGAAIATICEGGYRSSLAASLLAHEGISPLFNVTGGMAAYRALETR